MLQRPQTLWISIAIILAVLMFEFPFATGKFLDEPAQLVNLDAGSSMLLIVVTLLSVILSGATILSYTNLKKQKSFCWIGILISVVLCLIYLREWKAMTEASLTLTSIIPICIPISLWLAWLGIHRDLKLIRKMGNSRKS
jgi:hypothetical protein